MDCSKPARPFVYGCAGQNIGDPGCLRPKANSWPPWWSYLLTSADNDQSGRQHFIFTFLEEALDRSTSFATVLVRRTFAATTIHRSTVCINPSG
ncbi:hypothetical protein PBRA_005627 [Plasmodiophora brassicae]|uniref:Uncharacterized protein n=1 Tax=Plasmodiophora brassicae TaxID=37360 RepID=A0A0G4IP00_PLABS|nr:hypothetical protein PBRA_005627 [Plasmodiophora brassicae]